MSWTVQQLGQLLKLAEAGGLSDAELRRVAEHAPLKPRREDWLRAADRLLTFGGALLLGVAVVFFFAYNWADLHRFAKLGLALAALAACCTAAWFSPLFGTVYRAALLGACVTTGALLALVGQTYQTGADVWELFLAWALLMWPFVLLSRSSASWGLWLLVANAALLRMLAQSAWPAFPAGLYAAGPLLLVAALNLVVLLGFEWLAPRLLVNPQRHLQRLASAGVLGPLVTGGMVGWWEGEFFVVTLAFLATAAVATWTYYRLRRDLVILSLALFASIAFLTAALVRILPDELGFLLANLVAAFVIAGSALAAGWVVRLYRQGRPQ